MSRIDRELIEKEFESIKEKVEFVLETDLKSRNSDIRLLCKYLQLFSPYRVINKDEILNAIKISAKDIFKSLDITQIEQNIIKIIEQRLSKIPHLQYFPYLSTIHRVRRKIQNEEEKFIPTDPKIAEKRNIRADLIREYYIEQKQLES